MSDATVSTLDATVGLSGDSLSPGRLAFRRFLTHRAAVVSVVVLTLLVLWVLLSPFTARYGVNEQVFDISKGANQNLPPSRIAWFGTDIIGRDVYSRVLYGVRVSLIIGIASAFFSLVIGCGGSCRAAVCRWRPPRGPWRPCASTALWWIPAASAPWGCACRPEGQP